MNKPVWMMSMMFLFLMALFGRPFYAVANEDQSHSMQEVNTKASIENLKASPSMAQDGTINLNNQVCPVSGDKVGKDTVTHEGVNYQMCCGMCASKIEKNPSKYTIPKADIMEKIGR